jgi:hypothetical protein
MYKLIEGLTNDNLREILGVHITNAYSLKKRIEEDYRLNRSHADEQVPLWSEWCSEWVRDVSMQLEAVFESKIPLNQFNNTKPAPYGIAGENAKWCNINNYLDSKIDFLVNLNDKITIVDQNVNSGIVAGGSITAGGDIILNSKKITSAKSTFAQTTFGQIVLTIGCGIVLAGIIYYLDWN